MVPSLSILGHTVTVLLLTIPPVVGHGHGHQHAVRVHAPIIADQTLSINGIPFSTRAHWMRVANAALAELESPCPFSAFATAIVNHTSPGLGELVCIGVNSNTKTGNPTLHGEIAAITNCTAVMTDPDGAFKFTPSEAQAAHRFIVNRTPVLNDCLPPPPKCASAIRWSGFREYIYGTSIDVLIEQGWGQIRIPSISVFEQSFDLPTQARLMGGVLTNETDPLFFWQFNPDFPCPQGCARVSGTCMPSS